MDRRPTSKVSAIVGIVGTPFALFLIANIWKKIKVCRKKMDYQIILWHCFITRIYSVKKKIKKSSTKTKRILVGVSKRESLTFLPKALNVYLLCMKVIYSTYQIWRRYQNTLYLFITLIFWLASDLYMEYC